MTVIACAGFGGPEVLTPALRPVPSPGPGEVLIKIAAAGVNRADLLQRKGKYPPPPDASDIIGLEIAGTVVATAPDVTQWMRGDKVCALLAGGGYAEYATVPAAHCLPVPDNLNLAQAALLPEAIITVYANIFENAALQPGETILIHGGSSGIGTTAIQMARLHGARVFVTVGTAEKAAACRALGADMAVNYNEQDFTATINAITGHRGVDVVLDMIGGDYIARNLSILAPRGRHVSIATQKGAKAEIDMRMVMHKNLVITGSTLRGRPATKKARLIAAVTRDIWPWVAAGRLKPVVFQYFSLKNAAEAHKVMESGAHIGKIGLEVS
ncbi:MAG: NAD(P)H-quinone oxidoreductase [Alphaproteobacteria bacterium]|nr:NAD(P)H-quinone oxidoreductase [Alphaproteobacteria bacterium]